MLLRVTAGAAANDDAEQLGLATPQFQDVPPAPCVFRKTGSRQELLVSGAAVAAGLIIIANPQVVTAVIRAFTTPKTPPRR